MVWPRHRRVEGVMNATRRPERRYTRSGADAAVKDPAHRPLVIGSGIAGLYVALRARELGLRPTVMTKGRLEESNTRYAQGGIAAAIGPDDSPALHLVDTVRSGNGLVDRRAARLLTERPARSRSVRC